MKANETTPALTAEQLEAKIALKLLNKIDAANDKDLTNALGDYGMFTAAQYRRACTLQAHTLTKSPTLAP
jgi:hypothetical protein